MKKHKIQEIGKPLKNSVLDFVSRKKIIAPEYTLCFQCCGNGFSFPLFLGTNSVSQAARLSPSQSAY
jgi:hypothetical protein